MEATMFIVRLVILFWFYHRGTCSMCTNKQFLHNVKHGMMFAGHQYSNLSSEGIMLCSRYCLFARRCKSFNYNTVTGECQLNTDSTADVSSLTTHSDFIFSDISLWSARVAGPCEGHTCPLNSLCDPVDDVLYNCVNGKCLGVPMVENGFVKSPHQMSQIGTKLNITCNQGYLPEAEVLCKNNEEWSRGVCFALTSCGQVKQLQPASKDGEYWLFLTTNMYLSRIYCHGMSTEPQEFLSLKNLNYGNFPQISNTKCQGETNLFRNCAGIGGQIWFSKIKLNIGTGTTLGVFMTDFTFAKTSHSNHFLLAYGQAVDCYTEHFNGAESCGVKGRFTIDLRGTGWRISEDQKWVVIGWLPFMYPPQREMNGTIIKLNCGGFSGGCTPNGGLFLTPYPAGLNVDEE